MLTASFRRKTLLILLFTFLAAPGLSTAGSKPQHFQTVKSTEWAFPGFLSRIWSFLQKVPIKAGCEIDPSSCAAPNPSQTKAGCGIDPSGRCLP
jgi:hypothetical protein